MATTKKKIEKEEVVIRFSGDSGDGMQMTGTQFSNTTALLGNDVSTFPDYPAEIRAPQGTVGGVSGFQLHFGNAKVHTPGDYCDVLVAMNPAALKANQRWVKNGGTIIVNIDSFSEKNLKKAGFDENPLPAFKKGDYNVIEAPIQTLIHEAVKDLGLDMKSIERTKNMFALGITYWLFNRPLNHTETFFEQKFAKKPEIIEANILALHAGYNYANTVEALSSHYVVKKAELEKGVYRNINGNTATAWGLIAAAEKAKMPLFCGSYPITPASEILHELSARRDLGVKTFQAEDEIGGITTAIGASFAGNFAVTTTSGPGLALKTEAVGLAVIAELPLVIVDVQRGGPSTGLPTKTEQSDLLQAIYGRHGESPAVVIAASSPSNCFQYAFEAGRIALEHMVPVILLTDGFLANGSEPWRVPEMSSLPAIKAPFVEPSEKEYLPYERDPETLTRKWAVPGMKGFEHRVGGLEKMDKTGNVSYVPENHQLMSEYRQEKVNKVADDFPLPYVEGADEGELLVIGWGGTYGHLHTAVTELQEEGKKLSFVHFNYIYPLPKGVEKIFEKFDNLLVCELNLGQFADYLSIKVPGYKYQKYNKVQGLPFTVDELKNAFNKILEDK
ncbi:2-oxoacid:acceptor oxidoreductase subunit alpha [Salinivirga cyanobacteriivorans]|uniref:2-oxoglutarate oxidoreductase subunit KorA n=1 Tax=Salinivirga cyanobacteriivorans TaxID=1307839 RepID=A0A0S2I2U9_9BACT|nr:2-oxoacid:acceptor oxidoreductase subunit alpha [Salinivirga cyanobacteriivorans]ALO16576.1 2-oxoglutarate oxidoreductase subunit KorA [Salinivirga cyanobacteriivorans]